jgi:hypothetical protein
MTWTRETRLLARGGTPVKGDEGLSPLRAIGRRDGRRGIGWRRVALRDDPGRLPRSGHCLNQARVIVLDLPTRGLTGQPTIPADG